jgi:hypothetical protein
MHPRCLLAYRDGEAVCLQCEQLLDELDDERSLAERSAINRLLKTNTNQEGHTMNAIKNFFAWVLGVNDHPTHVGPNPGPWAGPTTKEA